MGGGEAGNQTGGPLNADFTLVVNAGRDRQIYVCSHQNRIWASRRRVL